MILAKQSYSVAVHRARTRVGSASRSIHVRMVWAAMFLVTFALSSVCTAGDFRVLIEPSGEGIAAHFYLDAPLEHFGFEPSGSVYRSRTWRITTPGLNLEDNAVVASDGRRFERFSLLISLDTVNQDRSYPALTRVGSSGFVLYAPYLRDEQNRAPVVTASLPADYQAVPFDPRQHPASPPHISLRNDGYVFIGPAHYLSRADDSSWIADGVPEWMTREARTTISRVMRYYRRRLAVRQRIDPLIVMTLADDEKTTWRGDVTAGNVMVLRFRGSAWKQPSEPLRELLVRFVAHESYHFWNGVLHSSRHEAEAPWLHEGAAEYAALVALQEVQALRPQSVLQAMQDHLNNCRRDLASNALQSGPARAGALHTAAASSFNGWPIEQCCGHRADGVTSSRYGLESFGNPQDVTNTTTLPISWRP